jgi:hypothetical protein
MGTDGMLPAVADCPRLAVTMTQSISNTLWSFSAFVCDVIVDC